MSAFLPSFSLPPSSTPSSPHFLLFNFSISSSSSPPPSSSTSPFHLPPPLHPPLHFTKPSAGCRADICRPQGARAGGCGPTHLWEAVPTTHGPCLRECVESKDCSSLCSFLLLLWNLFSYVVFSCTCTHAHTHTHAHMHTFTHAHMHTCTHTHSHMHTIHTHIHTFTHAHMPQYIHTHSHMHTCTQYMHTHSHIHILILSMVVREMDIVKNLRIQREKSLKDWTS